MLDLKKGGSGNRNVPRVGSPRNRGFRERTLSALARRLERGIPAWFTTSYVYVLAVYAVGMRIFAQIPDACTTSNDVQ